MKKKTITFLKYLGYYFIALLVSVILILLIDNIITKILGYNSVVELFSNAKKQIDKKGILLIVFVIPLIEEVIFRLLLKVNKINVSISLSLWLLLLIKNGKITEVNFNNYEIYFKLFIVILFGLILYKLALSDKIVRYLATKEKVLFYFSVLSFGLVHITNIKEFHWQLSLFYPFFVLPQIFMGYFIAKLRIEQGFIWGLLFHVVINAIGSI